MFPSSSRSLSSSPNELSLEMWGGWPLPPAGHSPGPRALEPCLSLGVTTCPLAPWSQAFMLLWKEAPQLQEQEWEQLIRVREAGFRRPGFLSPPSTYSEHALGQVFAPLWVLLPHTSFSVAIFYFSAPHFSFQNAFRHVGLTTSFYGRERDNHAHFTEQKTEVQRDSWMCLWSHHCMSLR